MRQKSHYSERMTRVEPGGTIPQELLHHRLQRALEYGRVTVPEMADELGVSRVTAWSYCHGRTKPNGAVLKIWAMRTGVDYNWLAGKDSPGKAQGRGVVPDNPGYMDQGPKYPQNDSYREDMRRRRRISFPALLSDAA